MRASRNFRSGSRKNQLYIPVDEKWADGRYVSQWLICGLLVQWQERHFATSFWISEWIVAHSETVHLDDTSTRGSGYQSDTPQAPRSRRSGQRLTPSLALPPMGLPLEGCFNPDIL